jgi:(R,R)-butanediol dehydrogenase / meso-butanediol dehydrogenase / diacetyl reductase
MRAIRYHGREDVRLDDIAEPSPKAGEVKLRVLYNGICGAICTNITMAR